MDYSELCPGELVILKPEWDDKNVKRVYSVLERNENTLSVQVVSEKVMGEKSVESMLNRVFQQEAHYFKPFM